MKKFLILFLTLTMVSCLVVSVSAADIFAGTEPETSGPDGTSDPTSANSTVSEPIPMPRQDASTPASTPTTTPTPTPAPNAADIFNNSTPAKPVVASDAETNLKTGGQAENMWIRYFVCILGSAVFASTAVIVDKRIRDVESDAKFESI